MKNNLKEFIKKIWRNPLKRKYKKQLKNHNFVIISSNCIGGCLLSDVGERFDSPTINLVIPEFVSFCEKLEYYLSKKPIEVSSPKYPVFIIENIFIHAIHYQSSQEFLNAWSRRTERFFNKIKNGAEIIIMATDSQLREPNAIERFLALPYKKICFTANKELLKNENFVFVPEFEGSKYVGDLTKIVGINGVRLFEKHFDCISFLNNIKG